MKKNILANDGIDAAGLARLNAAGCHVVTQSIPQNELIQYINAHEITALVVRSATKVRQDLIEACPGLKIIARGGVGMDNIDVAYAHKKGIRVINTPAASSQSVAELVFAHLFSAVRFLYQSNREIPLKGTQSFNELKKRYASGTELYGKTIGIIGFGRIGQAVAKKALGLGMHLAVYDPNINEVELEWSVAQNLLRYKVQTVQLENVWAASDVITFHVPGGEIIGHSELKQLKKGVVLINTARGGVINESALIEALDQGIVAHACLDVFENEPQPSEFLLRHPRIALSPHIGAATLEAQERIGQELAELLLQAYTNG